MPPTDFTWEPIKEVAKLFAGIFCAIIPVVAMLGQGKEATWRGWSPQSHRARARHTKSPISGYTGDPVGFPRQRADLLVFFELAGGDARELMGRLPERWRLSPWAPSTWGR